VTSIQEKLMKRWKLAAAVLTCLGALAGAGVAQAGPPGKWTQVTGVGKPDRNIVRVGLARTPDGVLHVGWEQPGAGNDASILHSSISADAKTVSGPNTIFTYPGGANNTVSLLPVSGGIRAFFSGLDAGNTLNGAMATATSSNGTSWAVQPTAASFGGIGAKPVYAASGLDGGQGLDGTFYSIWGDSSPNGGGYHVGLDGTVADNNLPGDLKSDTAIGVDSKSGQVVAAWNIIGGSVQVMPLSPAGAVTTLPNSGAAQLQHPVGITGRMGAAGLFVGFTQGTNEFTGKPAVYRVDSGKVLKVSNTVAQQISIAAAPEGRLWVFWKNGGTVLATRSNKTATAFGAVRKVVVPGGTSSSVFDLAGEASPGSLDLLALVQPSSGTLANYHQRILPGLTLKAKKGKKGKTLFTVTDAGDAVKGAKVKVKGGGSGKTSKAGTVSLSLAKGKHSATASLKGYASATLSVKVR
jgi:hypothetical protein